MEELKAEIKRLKTLLSNSEKVRVMEMKARDKAEKEIVRLKIQLNSYERQDTLRENCEIN